MDGYHFAGMLGGGFFLMGLGFTGLGMLSPEYSIYWALIGGFAIGAGNGLTAVGFPYIMQKEASPQALGRIVGIQISLGSIVFLFSPLLGGALVQAYSVFTVFQMVGLTICLIGLVGVLFISAIMKRKNAN